VAPTAEAVPPVGEGRWTTAAMRKLVTLLEVSQALVGN
jgi:hypothetical protein